MLISKILLPVDFSERAGAAARYLAPLATRFQAEVVLLHVLAPDSEFGAAEMGTVVPQELLEERRAKALCRLQKLRTEQFAGLRTSCVLLQGDPARMIVEYAHEEACALICMPTHGHGPFRRLLLGSVTAKVLHDSDCPVWTGVHMEGPAGYVPGTVERLVCAIDLGPNSAKVLSWAKRVAEEFHGALSVVHAVSSLQPTTEAYQLSPEWRSFVVTKAQEEIANLLQTAGIDCPVFVKLGGVRDVICAEATRLDADLVVIGRSAKAGILGRLTEHAYTIIRASPCPALSV